MPNSESLFGGKYQTVRPLGEGGMGTVFEVENLLTQKRAAIKRLHPRFKSGEGFAKRMLREARAMARIRHQNVVVVYDVLLDDQDICVVMELLQGELLSQRLARGAISIADFLALLLPAMRGVAAAHEVGVVHRDIKPDNIFLATENGRSQPTPKVIDFGISKVFNNGEEASTCSGVTMGTPRYVSYEQLRGLRDVDGRTDVYAFGVILYEALTGKAPYAAETLGQQAIQFVTCVPPAMRSLRAEIPEVLATSVERAIARDREHRHATLNELVEELAPLLDNEALLHDLPAFSPVPAASTAPELADLSRTTSQASSLAPMSNRSLHGAVGRALSWKQISIGLGLTLATAASLSWAALAANTPSRVEPTASAPKTAHGAPSEQPVSPTAPPPLLSEPKTVDARFQEPTTVTHPTPGNRRPSTRRTTRTADAQAVPPVTDSPLASSPDPAVPQNNEEPDPSPARSGRLSRGEF